MDKLICIKEYKVGHKLIIKENEIIQSINNAYAYVFEYKGKRFEINKYETLKEYFKKYVPTIADMVIDKYM